MTKKAYVEDVYKLHKKQVDTIVSYAEGNYKKAGKIITWFYGGSVETWRKFVAKLKIEKPVPDEVSELLMKLKQAK